MKKNVIIILLMLLAVISICIIGISIRNKKVLVQKQTNKEYEQYMNKDIYGTDVITLINKAIDNNKKNNVLQDEKEYFLENSDNSLIIEVEMITNEEKEKTKIYRMETINRGGIQAFITNFNTTKFQITDIKYHEKNNKLKYIKISQKYE